MPHIVPEVLLVTALTAVLVYADHNGDIDAYEPKWFLVSILYPFSLWAAIFVSVVEKDSLLFSVGFLVNTVGFVPAILAFVLGDTITRFQYRRRTALIATSA